MSDPTAIPPKGTFDTVIGYVRKVRAGLENAVDALGHQPADAALGYANGMKAGLDTALITLEHLARLASRAPEVAEAETSKATETLKKKHLFHICAECELAFFPDTPHDCETAGNGFTQTDLNRLVGWQGYRLRWPDGTLDEPVNPENPLDGLELDQKPDGDEPDEDEPHSNETPSPLGMREGSKKHRVYEQTRKLLEQNGEMHIDAMLESIMELGVFAGVKNPRVNFANLLSQFRNKGLVDSDYMGNYSLPNGKATD